MASKRPVYVVDTDPLEGFAIEVWMKRSRSEESHVGVLVVTDGDMASRLDSSKSGSLVVLERDQLSSSGWVAHTLTDFAPAQRKGDVLARVGEHDWTPVTILLEKLERARRRGEDVLGMPAIRVDASVEFETRMAKKRRPSSEDSEEPRGRPTGKVDAGPDGVEYPEGYWSSLASFVSRLPLANPPKSPF